MILMIVIFFFLKQNFGLLDVNGDQEVGLEEIYEVSDVILARQIP